MSTAQHVDPHIARPPAAGPWLRPPVSSRMADVRAVWRRSWALVAAIALRVIPGPAQILAYVWSAGYALLGRRQAIMALVMLWLFNMFTHAFGPPPGYAAIFRHLTVLSAALSVLLIHVGAPPRSRTPNLLTWTGILNVLLVIHSMVFSTMPDVSLPKAISFGLAIQALLVAWSRLSPYERSVTENQMWGVLYAIAVLSIPLVASGRGYVRTGRGFQGLLEHPQAFGPTMAIMAVWLFTTWLTDQRMNNLLKMILGLSLAWIYLAAARIGLVVFIVGMVTAFCAGPFTVLMNGSARVPRILKGRLAFLVAALAMVLVGAGPLLAGRFQQFIAKQGKSTSAVEAAWESRGPLVEAMQKNIREHPVTGIGLGVASETIGFSAVARDPIFGFVIMAAVEKGVLPVAMVEEMGWPLALLYAPWFFALLVLAIRAGPRYAGVCAAALTVNAGECVFFSPGGGGLLIQMFVTMAATAPPASQDSLMMRGPVRAPTGRG